MAEAEITQVAEEAVNTAIDLATQEFEVQARPTAEQVRASARELIAFTEVLQSRYRNNVAEMNAIGNNIESAMKFSKKMVQTRQDFKDLMQRVLDFQNISNNFLGQQVQMTFMYIAPRTGQVTLYAVDNSVEDLTLDVASKSHGGMITGRYARAAINRQLGQTAREIVNSKYDSGSLESTFGEVYNRYKISKARLKLKGAAYILWKNPEWDGVWISGAGPLGEAYVNFFINEYKFHQMMEGNVQDFMVNPNYGAVLADNASGFLQGDVTKGAIEFGVKIQGATAMGYMEIINYARDLLDAADVKSYLEGLKQKLHDAGVSNMVKPLEGLLDDEVNSLIEPLEERISKG